MAMKRTASDILADQHWKRRILSNETSYLRQTEPSVDASANRHNRLDSGKMSVPEGSDLYSCQTDQVSSAEHNSQTTSKCHEVIFEIQDVPLAEVTGTSVENGSGKDQLHTEKWDQTSMDFENNQQAVSPSLLGLSENPKRVVPLESETLDSTTCTSGNILFVKEDPVCETLIIVPAGSEDCKGEVSPLENEDSITEDADQDCLSLQAQDSQVIGEVSTSCPAPISNNIETDDTAMNQSEDKCLANSVPQADRNPDLQNLALDSVSGSVSEQNAENILVTNGAASNQLIHEASLDAQSANDLQANIHSVQYMHDAQNASKNAQENPVVSCKAPPEEPSVTTSKLQPNVTVEAFVPVSQTTFVNGVAESVKRFQDTAQPAMAEQCCQVFQTPEVPQASNSDQPVTSAAEYANSSSEINTEMHEVPPGARTVPVMPPQIPWQMNPTSQLSSACNSTEGIPVHISNTMNYCASEQHPMAKSGFVSHANHCAGYPGTPRPQFIEQGNAMNYQHFMTHEQQVHTQLNTNGQLQISQPQVGSTVPPMQNPASQQYTSQPVAQPNPTNVHAYRKNEGSFVSQQRSPHASHVSEGLDHCATSLFHPGDFMQNTNGNSSTGFHRQLPELMLHNSDLGGYEATKDNFYGMNQNIAPNNGNFHPRQALTQMNVPHQYWSAQRHGTPICSTKPYGPPRHYRPAPYTFPACICTGSPVNMPACRNCRMGHSNLPSATRHPRSFNSSYTEYTCRGDHKVFPRRSASCFHIGQQTPDCSLHADNEMSPITPSFTPKSRQRQMGDFSAEGVRFHNKDFQSNSWHSAFSHSSDFSSDSDSPMIMSRAQPGLGCTGDMNSLGERQVPENSLSNPNNPVFKNLPPPGLQRTKFLVSTYIDYLVEENERITDMSKAFTPPTYLFLEEEQYVLQAHKEEVPFPSNRFSRWIKQYFPQVDAISVPEGKSKENSTNISRLNLSEKSFDEFAHTVFFGCQDMQDKGKAVPVHAPVQKIAENPAIMTVAQPQPQAATGN
ncbi:uncharacterized protein LOC135474927 [Liolophura sinensis]|uniref:uncharacterized protein LOC135474927 n=1 Tax=Liolophura sinensis TaxID=3198878 RepID=UPI003158D613